MEGNGGEGGGGRHLIVEHQGFDHIVAFLKKIMGRSCSVYRDKSEEQTNCYGSVSITKCVAAKFNS